MQTAISDMERGIVEPLLDELIKGNKTENTTPSLWFFEELQNPRTVSFISYVSIVFCYELELIYDLWATLISNKNKFLNFI